VLQPEVKTSNMKSPDFEAGVFHFSPGIVPIPFSTISRVPQVSILRPGKARTQTSPILVAQNYAPSSHNRNRKPKSDH